MDPFERLPLGILEIIVRQLPDLSTIHDLCTASRTVFSLCHADDNLLPLVETIMQRSPTQIRELMVWCMEVKSNPSRYTSFSRFKDKFRQVGIQFSLRDQGLTSSQLCSLLAMANNVRTLADVYVQEANQFCLALPTMRLASKRFGWRAHFGDDRPYRPIRRFDGEPFKPQDAGEASWPELQRVYCALWRVVLYATVRQSREKENLDQITSCEQFWSHLTMKFMLEQMCTVTERLFPMSADISLGDLTARAQAGLKTHVNTSRLSCVKEPSQGQFAALAHPTWGYTEINNFYSVVLQSPLRFVKVEVFRPFGFYIWDNRRMSHLGFAWREEWKDESPPPPCNTSDEMFRMLTLLSEEQIAEIERVQESYWPSLETINVNVSPYDIPAETAAAPAAPTTAVV